jgi:hypothetical protein
MPEEDPGAGKMEQRDEVLDVPLPPISLGGMSAKKRASRVAGTRCGSYGEALATCTSMSSAVVVGQHTRRAIVYCVRCGRCL